MKGNQSKLTVILCGLKSKSKLEVYRLLATEGRDFYPGQRSQLNIFTIYIYRDKFVINVATNCDSL